MYHNMESRFLFSLFSYAVQSQKVYLYIHYHYEQYKTFWTCTYLCVSVQYVIFDQCSIYNSVKPLNIIQILHAVYSYEQNQKKRFFHNASIRRCRPSLASNVPHSKPLLKRLSLYIHFIGHNSNSLLIIQQIFQVTPTIASVFSPSQKVICRGTQPTDPILEPAKFLKDFNIKPFPTCNITLQPCLCAQNNFIMLLRTKTKQKNIELDKTAAIK